jgi:hypothetical protein
MKSALVSFVFAATTALGATQPAGADDFTCPPNNTGTIPGNLIVPGGNTCHLQNAQVLGNVIVEPRATLTADNSIIVGNVEIRRDGSFVATETAIGRPAANTGGNVHGTDVNHVVVGPGSAVFGNLYIHGAKAPDLNGCDGATVHGDIQLIEFTSPAVAHVCGCDVRGDVQIVKGSPFLVDIDENNIDGNLQISDTRATGGIPATDLGLEEKLVGYLIFGNQVRSEPFVFPQLPVGGNLQFYRNDGNVAIFANAVGANLQFIGNRGLSAISANVIRENLDCYDNTPPPSNFGVGNVAEQANGQCAGLLGPLP